MVSRHLAKIGGHRHFGSGDKTFLSCKTRPPGNPARPPDVRALWLCGMEFLQVIPCSAKFGAHRHCGVEIKCLLFVTWSRKITWSKGNMTFCLWCHQGKSSSCEVCYRWEPLIVSHHPTTFGGHRQCGSGDVIFLLFVEQYSTCSPLNRPLLFYLMGRVKSTRHIMLISSKLATHT